MNEYSQDCVRIVEMEEDAWCKKPIGDYVNGCKLIVAKISPSKSISDHECDGLSEILYHMFEGCIKGNIQKDHVSNVLDIISGMHDGLKSIILDIFNVLDAETGHLDAESRERKTLHFLIKAAEKVFTGPLLKERLELETLTEAKILTDKSFEMKLIKIKTRLYYKQKKFNLFREESEGYAKLITELNQGASDVMPPLSYTIEVIQSLIGCFNLDPNRVLSVILDSFECNSDRYEFYVPLIKVYIPRSKAISEALGFKYTHYENAGGQGGEKSSQHLLHLCTARLLQNQVIALNEIYDWLSPSDAEIVKSWEGELEEAAGHFKQNSAVLVSIKEGLEEEPASISEKYGHYQKFGLLEALIKIGDWKNFQLLSRNLPPAFVMATNGIARHTCRLLDALIEPLYNLHNLNFRASASNSKRGKKFTLTDLCPKPPKSFLDMRVDVFPMLHTLGSYLSQDPVLLYKFLRLVKKAFETASIKYNEAPSEDTIYYDAITLMDESFLPALSALESNCCAATEIWDIMTYFPYTIRYAMYYRWKSKTPFKYPDVLTYNGEVVKKIKEVMKKMTKENIKVVGRQLGKLTHSAPGPVIEYVLNQTMLYDNLIPLVADAMRFMGNLSLDVLCYCLIEAMLQPNRMKNKHTNGVPATWLVNISSFAGIICKKINMDISGLLQYICNQLKLQKSFDLLILKEMIYKMSGIEYSEDMTNEQLMALCGGETLRTEGGYFSRVKNVKKSQTRLKENLLHNDLGISLCILMAQQRDCIIYKEASSVKSAAYLYDQCQDTLVQYSIFLTDAMSEEYFERLPPVHTLISEYRLKLDAAFSLTRSAIMHNINKKYQSLCEGGGKKAGKFEKYLEASTAVTAPIAQAVSVLTPPKLWEDMSPNFLVLFWSLTMTDIEVPTESYIREMNKLREGYEEISKAVDWSAAKVKRERERHATSLEKFSEEKKKLAEHVDLVKYRLNKEKEEWFGMKGLKSTKNETITQFLQYCIIPRCLFTPMDALYCAKFMHLLHAIQTPNFSSLLCYDRLFCEILLTITLCTENEARRYGRFLCEALGTVMRWHADEGIYNRECASYPGFVTKFKANNTFSNDGNEVGYDNYRHVVHKWHYKITKCVVFCLESDDYVQIRNALLVLIKILQHFPIITKLANIIEKKVEKVIEDEKTKNRGLSVLATSYNGLLKGRHSRFVREQDFHGENKAQAQTPQEVKKRTSNGITKPPTAAVTVSLDEETPTKKENDVKVSNGDEKRSADRKKGIVKRQVLMKDGLNENASPDRVDRDADVKRRKVDTNKQAEDGELLKDKEKKKTKSADVGGSVTENKRKVQEEHPGKGDKNYSAEHNHRMDKEKKSDVGEEKAAFEVFCTEMSKKHSHDKPHGEDKSRVEKYKRKWDKMSDDKKSKWMKKHSI